MNAFLSNLNNYKIKNKVTKVIHFRKIQQFTHIQIIRVNKNENCTSDWLLYSQIWPYKISLSWSSGPKIFMAAKETSPRRFINLSSK